MLSKRAVPASRRVEQEAHNKTPIALAVCQNRDLDPMAAVADKEP